MIARRSANDDQQRATMRICHLELGVLLDMNVVDYEARRRERAQSVAKDSPHSPAPQHASSPETSSVSSICSGRGLASLRTALISSTEVPTTAEMRSGE